MTRLLFDNVTKSFGATRALRGVSFEAKPGSVHAIVGENGAGKSTLMNILAGAVKPDSGTITVDGAPHTPKDPQQARDAGVAMVHQELSLCTHLTVAENIVLGVEPSRFGVLNRRAIQETAQKALAEVLPQTPGGDDSGGITPGAKVSDLPPSARQLVEIARAISHPACRVLVLDEPTSSLTSHDAARLFQVIHKLRDKGLTILYISHFLEEVMAIADRYTVFRDGVTVASGNVADTSVNDLVEKMAGRRGEEVFPPRTKRSPGEEVVHIEHLAGKVRPVDVSLSLRRGEIVGLFGLVGAGRTEFFRALFGLDPIKNGSIKVGSFLGPASPSTRLSQGVGLLSEDRAAEGVALSLSISDNIVMSALRRLSKWGFFLPKTHELEASRWVERLSIKTSDATLPVSSLSGGNQQKAAIARLLCRDVDIFLLDEPTRGIDITSKTQIYKLLIDLAAKGKAVLVISSYLPELLGICDRIAVMSRGTLGPLHEVGGLREEDLLREALGA
ncbi:MAG: sugar ABC transporter ATP-binding protein [Polyangiaceae bacterium]|nr:sugar ABC transporter ATP-binding protein [Polyangiaceae bacterium]